MKTILRFHHVVGMGQKAESVTKYKTLFPEYYQVILFDDVSIPDADDFLYAGQVNLRVYDYDTLGKHDYIGTVAVGLQDAVVTEDPDQDILQDPRWYELYKEAPGDSQGALLVLVQLVPSMGRFAHKLTGKERPAPRSIVPASREAFIEVIAVGIRDMAPYNFQSMQAPFLEIELNSMGAKYLQITQPSKRPNPSNPNFLEKLVLPCQLPIKSIYASPLQLRARDTRLGGYLKPVVGVGIIDLSKKVTRSH